MNLTRILFIYTCSLCINLNTDTGAPAKLNTRPVCLSDQSQELAKTVRLA